MKVKTGLVRFGVVVPAAVVAAFGQGQASFTPVGDLTGSLVSSQASAISGDGSTVVGMSLSANGQEAFRFRAGAITGLGDLPGFNFESYARGVNFDGTVIVGNGSSGADGNVGFMWRQGSGMTSLKDLNFGATLARAFAVSGDGTIAAGYATSASGRETTRWTSNGNPIAMGDFAGGTFWSEARAVSADGSVIAGFGSRGSQVGSDAYRWTQAGGFEYLGDLPGGNVYSDAMGISSDGNVIVGNSVGNNAFGNAVPTAYRWTLAGGMVGLSTLEIQGRTHAYAVSPDGSIVGGDASDGIGQDNAVIWRADGQIIDVKEALIAAGLANELAGWDLTSVTGVALSQNGYAVVCGNGTNSLNQEMGWTAKVPLNPVPEPATIAALSIGALALIRKRKQRQSE